MKGFGNENMTISALIVLIAIIFIFLSTYLYTFLPAYEKKIEDEEDKLRPLQRKDVKRYLVAALIGNLIICGFYIFLYKNNELLQNIKTISVVTFLWAMAFYDFKFHKIPNKILLWAFVLRVLEFVPELLIYKSDVLKMVLDELIIVFVLFVICMICNFVMKNAIGMGDVKMLMVMGLYLGSEKLFSVIMVSLVIAFLGAIILLAIGKKGRKDEMAFAPFILAGTYLAAILIGI